MAFRQRGSGCWVRNCQMPQEHQVQESGQVLGKQQAVFGRCCATAAGTGLSGTLCQRQQALSSRNLSGSQSNTSSFPCRPSDSTWTPGATQPLLLAHSAQPNLCPADDSGRCCGLAKVVFVGSCASDQSAGHSHHPGSPEWTSRATFAEELGRKKNQ